MKGLADFTALRCPYCKYIWSSRANRSPVSCPRCKKRFDYPGSMEKPESATISTASYSTMRKWLDDANRFSKRCESMDDVLSELEKL